MSNPIATESGHWYTRVGEPCYTIVGKNGKPRNTTLADARRLALVPSVTTVNRSAAAPALEAWKLQQMLLASLTLPRIEGEAENLYVARIVQDSRDQGEQAAARGTAIHTAIEHTLAGAKPLAEFVPHAEIAIRVLKDHFAGVTWASERAFASSLGYGGKIDLYSTDANGYVVDFKTKDGDLSKVKCYDEHFMQAAAYRFGVGLPDARCANIFISRGLFPEAVLIEHTPEESARGWQMFRSLLDYWYAKTGLPR